MMIIVFKIPPVNISCAQLNAFKAVIYRYGRDETKLDVGSFASRTFPPFCLLDIVCRSFDC